MKATTSSAVLALTLVAAMCAPGGASAAYNDTSAGGACQAASGANAKSFNFSNNYLTNIGTTQQFVICHFAMNDDSGVRPIGFLAVHTQSTLAGARTVSCSAQTGSFFSGANQVHAVRVETANFSEPGAIALEWNTALLPRSTPYQTFTLNCRMDPGTRVGLIELRID